MIVAALASPLIAASTPAAAVTLFDQQSLFAAAAGGVRFENFDRFSGINSFAAAPFDVGSFRLSSSPGASATNAVRSGGGSVVNGTTQVVGRVEDGSRSLFIELDEYSTVFAADFRGFNNPLSGQARTDLVINGQLVGVPILGGESDTNLARFIGLKSAAPFKTVEIRYVGPTAQFDNFGFDDVRYNVVADPADRFTIYDSPEIYDAAVGRISVETFDQITSLQSFTNASLDVGPFSLSRSPGASGNNAVSPPANGPFLQVAAGVEDGSRSMFIDFDRPTTTFAADFRSLNNPNGPFARTDIFVDGRPLGLSTFAGNDRFFGVTSEKAFRQIEIRYVGLEGGRGRDDFSFDNVRYTAVPEPATWTVMIAGFALLGGTLRRNRLRCECKPAQFCMCSSANQAALRGSVPKICSVALATSFTARRARSSTSSTTTSRRSSAASASRTDPK